MTRVGLISDTHNLLRPQALAFLQGSDWIIHAGDVCSQPILDQLASLAPMVAVRGNNDRGDWVDALPEERSVCIEAVTIHVIHDRARLVVHRLPSATRVVVAGHSHKPSVSESQGILHVNPGSAGPRRFKLPISVGELIIRGEEVQARWVEL